MLRISRWIRGVFGVLGLGWWRGLLRGAGGSAERGLSKSLIRMIYPIIFQNFHFSWKKRLRVLGVNLRTPFTGGAEALRGATEADGTEGADALEGLDGLGGDKKFRGISGRARRKLGRTGLVLSLRSLTSRVSEEICGRFGSFDE